MNTHMPLKSMIKVGQLNILILWNHNVKFQESERNRHKETKNKLMQALSEVEMKIDKVENDIRLKTRTKEKLEEEERLR